MAKPRGPTAVNPKLKEILIVIGYMLIPWGSGLLVWMCIIVIVLNIVECVQHYS